MPARQLDLFAGGGNHSDHTAAPTVDRPRLASSGNPLSSAFLAFALPTNAIVPTDPVFAEKAKRVPPDARSRRSRSRARSRLFVQVKGAPGIPGNLVAKFVRREQTAFRASRRRRRSCRSLPDLPNSTEAAGPNPLW